MDLQIIGKFIKERRKEKKLTQVQLANKTKRKRKDNIKMGVWQWFPRHKPYVATMQDIRNQCK